MMENSRAMLFNYIIFATIFLHSSASQLGTLRTFQRHACDGSSLGLSCPDHTSIDILHANYGDATLSHKMASRCPITDNRRSVHPNSTHCTFSSLEYSTTQRVVELCHSRRQCKIDVQADTFTDDEPCPHHAKYLEVAFKCRPAIFINKIICEDEILRLQCGPTSKIAIYSVFFGRTKDGSLKCPQTNDVPQGDCQASFASEIVMKRCHGHHSCEIEATTSVFGTPCPHHYHMYMKAVYACVPSTILRSDFGPESVDENSDTQQNDANNLTSKEAKKGTMSKEDLINCTVTILSGSKQTEVGIITDWMRAVNFMNKNEETLILYLVVGGCVGAVVCLVALVMHLWWQRRTQNPIKQLTSTFSADFEDLDGDVDLMGPLEPPSHMRFTPPPPPDPQGVRYYPRPSALNDTDLILPRSLSRQNHQYLYS